MPRNPGNGSSQSSRTWSFGQAPSRQGRALVDSRKGSRKGSRQRLRGSDKRENDNVPIIEDGNPRELLTVVKLMYKATFKTNERWEICDTAMDAQQDQRRVGCLTIFTPSKTHGSSGGRASPRRPVLSAGPAKKWNSRQRFQARFFSPEISRLRFQA